MANKIKFGLRNVHYAILTESVDSTTGEITTSYSSVKSWPGAVSLSLEPQGSDNPFYADDRVYYRVTKNNGYSGDFESALIPDDVYESILNMERDDDDILVESASNSNQNKYFALLFEIDGDAKARRFCFYKVSLTRPTIAGATKEEDAEPQTETVTLTAVPRANEDQFIRAVADESTAATTYTNWFSAVPVPTFTPPVTT